MSASLAYNVAVTSASILGPNIHGSEYPWVRVYMGPIIHGSEYTWVRVASHDVQIQFYRLTNSVLQIDKFSFID